MVYSSIWSVFGTGKGALDVGHECDIPVAAACGRNGAGPSEGLACSARRRAGSLEFGTAGLACTTGVSAQRDNDDGTSMEVALGE